MIARLLKQDAHFQFRHGLYYIYAAVTIVYILILMFVPLEYRSFWGALIIYSDPGTLGLFFSGAIILLERNQQLLTYMFVTPVTLRTFLASKIISLFLIGLLTSVLIASVSLNTTFSLIQLTIAVMLCSVFFTCCGLAVSIMSPSLNHFMFRSIVLLIVLNIPIVSFFQWFELSLLEWFPVYSSFFLIQFSLSGAQVDVSFIRHVVQLIFWGVLSFIWTYRCFQRYIVNDTGESKEVHI